VSEPANGPLFDPPLQPVPIGAIGVMSGSVRTRHRRATHFSRLVLGLHTRESRNGEAGSLTCASLAVTLAIPSDGPHERDVCRQQWLRLWDGAFDG
jgi:hypothetical protein